MSTAPAWRRAVTRIGVRRALKRIAATLGFDLVKRTFYSPIPDWRPLPDEVWTRRSSLRGIAWDTETQMSLLERELAPYFPDFKPQRERSAGGGAEYHYGNGFYGAVDADVLYAFIRHLRPRRVIELGSGYSSLVIGMARADEPDGERPPPLHDVYDPFCRPDLAPAIRKVADLHLTSANDVALSVFEQLDVGDVLFVDTTHTVKLDSDVNFVVLDVLPLLRPGVVIHFHDIFLPWEYPKAWLTDPEVFWTEQYLLQAFLAHNLDFEVLLANAAVLREKPARVAELIPSAPFASGASSFWIRRRA